MNQEQMASLVAKRVMTKLADLSRYLVPVGVSARHVHVTNEVFAILFGPDAVMTKKVDVKQPGQFAANEQVAVVGPKGQFDRVRILGPARKFNQIEVSKTDCFKLGIPPMIRLSGNIAGTPGVKLIGPKGEVELKEGCIVAMRHVHMLPEQAEQLGLKDGEIVDIETFGDRCGVFGDVVMRVNAASALEIHIDTDEANALSLKDNDLVLIRKQR
ncbi:MAG: phosphate propanoyltransferase [Lachnospiraceae bacterium]|nr:phosphate propanoyltransferase [Lachnospiraceae bacterium]